MTLSPFWNTTDGTALTTATHARGEIEFEMGWDRSGAKMRTSIFMTKVDTAIGTLNGYFNQLGIDQRSLSGKEVNRLRRYRQIVPQRVELWM